MLKLQLLCLSSLSHHKLIHIYIKIHTHTHRVCKIDPGEKDFEII